MSTLDTSLMTGLIFLAAVLYSSVGHAGASAYLAAMALFGLAPEVMKPTALCLNILVATIGTVRFYRAGHFSWKLFWPFALGSIPLAFLGGAIRVPGTLYKNILGAVLLYAAVRLLIHAAKKTSEIELHQPRHATAIGTGAGIGFLSGLTGVGGGIFLSPLMLLMRWAAIKRTAATSVAFILVNSVAGLLGHVTSLQSVPGVIWVWAPAALAGGLIGSELGSRRLNTTALRWLLAGVLILAGFKLLSI
jgi:uncharacterized protein